MTTLTTSNKPRRSVLADRGFRALYAADTASELGTQVSYLALPVLAQTELRAGPGQVGLLAALSTVAFLLIGLPAGVWVDRTRKRGVLIMADLARAALLGSVPLAWALGVLSLAQLYVVVLATGVATVFFDVAHLSFVPHVVGRDRLTAANASLAGMAEAADVSGRGIGGFIVQLAGPPMAVVVDMASYLCSALCIGQIRVAEPAPEPGTRQSLPRAAWAGLSYVLTDPYLRPLALKGVLANLGIQVCQVCFLVLFTARLHLSAGVLGLVLSAGGVGGFAGAMVAPRIGRRLGHGRGIWITGMCAAPFALFSGLIGRGPWLWIGAAGWMIAIIKVGVDNVLGVTLRQTVTPDGMLGRMNAGFRFLLTGALSIGGIAAGLIASLAGVRAAIWAGAAVLSVSWLTIRFSPLRAVRDPGEIVAAGKGNNEAPAGGAAGAPCGKRPSAGRPPSRAKALQLRERNFRRVRDAQLAAGSLVERGVAKPDDPRGVGQGRDLKRRASADVAGHLPVDLDREPAACLQHLQADRVVHRKHDPSVVGRMRCGRGDDKRLDGGRDDRAAGREAVRGRSGRRRDHDRVRRVRDERLAVNPHRD